MKQFKQLLCYIFVLSIFTMSAFAFTDVTKDYEWASPSITNLSQKGFINGYPDGTFAPGKNITRAEFAKLVISIFGNKTQISYDDILETDWFYPYVSQSGGYFITEENFLPNQNITRQEVTYALFAGLNLTDSPMDRSIPFRDLDKVEEAYLPAVKTLARVGLTNGYPDGSFGPDKEITRAEIATVLERAINYTPSEDNENNKNNENSENSEETKEDLKTNNYFFVVSRVSTVMNERNELLTKVEGYQDGKLTTLLIDEDVTISKSALASDNNIDPGDVLSYSRNFFDEINHISLGFNAKNLPHDTRIELLTIGNTTKRHIAVGTVKRIYQLKGIELVSLEGNAEKLYEVSDSVNVYVLKENGKVELSDFLEITDSRYEAGDTVVAFSNDDVLQEILVIKE